jgi:hypothetical protein
MFEYILTKCHISVSFPSEITDSISPIEHGDAKRHQDSL